MSTHPEATSVDLGGSSSLTAAAIARLRALPPGAFDVVFRPAETVSTLYAYAIVHGDPGDAGAVLDAHRAGVRAARTYLDREAAWAVTAHLVDESPLGSTHEDGLASALQLPERREEARWRAAWNRARQPAAGAYSVATGLRALQIDHDTADAGPGEEHGDPFVHSHVVISPDVVGADDGLRYRLDVSSVLRELPGAAAVYEATYEAELSRSLGVDFTSVAGSSTRQVRGIERHRFSGDQCVLPANLHQVGLARS